MLFLVGASAAEATFAIDEVFSNADGTVQYVVLHETQNANGQQALRGTTLTATRGGASRTFTLDHDLASSQTAGRRVLLATAGYAVLGLAAADYVIPNRFVPTDTATLTFTGAPALAYAALPLDGSTALFANGATGANVATNFAGDSATIPAAPVTSVEYYNRALDHYFLSDLAPDLEALDSARIPGWARTGQTFRVWPSAAAAPAGAQPVCRFLIPPEHGNSHFFSASPAECASVAAKIGTDPNYSGYVLETPAAFHVLVPDAAGTCPAGLVPVYRLWNTRADSNHRYTTDLTVRAEMLARGYVAEGSGPQGVVMCAAPDAPASVARASDLSPLFSGCDDDIPTGVLFTNSEVEPRVDIDPRDSQHLVGVWQQDRWSNGGARALYTGTSFDGGRTWTKSAPAFSRCTGGATQGANYARVSDPWVSFSPDGTVHQIAIAFTGPDFGTTSTNAVLASRSTDGGLTWSAPAALIRDGAAAFNDKESITADPTDSRFVYAVWDRVLPSNTGPTWFARSTDGGGTWEPARMIHDPGRRGQTLNNQIVVAPSTGMLMNFFTEFQTIDQNQTVATLLIQRSTDRGATWSTPIAIGSSLPAGASDPETHVALRDAANLGAIAASRDGRLAVAWQDARTSGGVVEAILFTQSNDAGTTWSPPVRINADPTVHAFLPTIKFRDDGTIGVLYYDFRNNTSDPSTLPTDVWLTQSSDGVTWRETHVWGPFDFANAPNARGLFLGDYQGLASTGTSFLPFFAVANPDPSNRSDVLAGLASLAASAKALEGRESTVVIAAPAAAEPSPQAFEAARATARRVLERRWRIDPATAATAAPTGLRKVQ